MKNMTEEINSAECLEDKGEEVYRKHNNNRQVKKIRTSGRSSDLITTQISERENRENGDKFPGMYTHEFLD